jgi:hypothetical protein
MSRGDSKRARHRQRQARYEASLREGVALYLASPSAIEMDALVHRGGIFFIQNGHFSGPQVLTQFRDSGEN